MIFTLSIGGFQLISELNSGYLNFLVAQQVTSTFHFTGQNQHENTITLGELYRKEGVWYFAANMQSFVGELNEIINRKKVILYQDITNPEMFNNIAITQQKHEQLLIDLAGESGCVVSIGLLDALYKIYAFFMNKSDVFIMYESTLLQRIPSKRNRLLILKMDVSKHIVDKRGNPITLEMKNCVKKMNALSKFFNDTAISYDDKTNTYQFSNLQFTVSVPKLSDAEKEAETFDLDFYQETIMDYGFDEMNLRQIATYRTLKLLDRQKPIDILIKKNKIIAFQQGEQIAPTSHSPDTFDVDIVLRSYNFCYFDRKVWGITKDTHNDFVSVVEYVDIRVIRNYDDMFWLHSSVEWLNSHIDIYEHLEVISR